MSGYFFHCHPGVFYPHSKNALPAMGQTVFLKKGTWTALCGPSGRGKTTFLRFLAGLNVPFQADPCLDADCSQHRFLNTYHMHECSKRQEKHAHDNPICSFEEGVRADIAFQHPDDRLLPWLNVARNIALFDLVQKRLVRHERVTALLATLDMGGSEALMPHQLSTGMERRILLGRTLYQERPLLFLDEPLSNVDKVTKAEILTKLRLELQDKTVLFITHDAFEATFADQVWYVEGAPLHIKKMSGNADEVLPYIVHNQQGAL